MAKKGKGNKGKSKNQNKKPNQAAKQAAAKKIAKQGSKISRKEQTKLERQGISRKQIVSVAKKNKQTVAIPASNTRQLKNLAKAAADQRVTKSEAKNLRSLGVPKATTKALRNETKIQNSIGGISVGRELRANEIKPLLKKGFSGQEILGAATAKGIDVGGAARKRLDGTADARNARKRYNEDVRFGGKTLDEFLAAPEMGTEYYRNGQKQTYIRPGEEQQLSPGRQLLQPLYDKNPNIDKGEIFRLAATLGLKSVNSENDVKQMLRLMNAGGGYGGGGNSGYSVGSADRRTGEFDDIIAAYGDDIREGQRLTQTLQDLKVPTSSGRYEAEINELKNTITELQSGGGGLASSAQAEINDLKDQVASLTGTGGNQVARGNDATGTGNNLVTGTGAVTPTGNNEIDNTLSNAVDFQDQINAINASLNSIPASIKTAVSEQTAAATATNNAINQELQAANAALQEQQRITSNLARAYVPPSNPTALTPSIGDDRTNLFRKPKNNTLSDLTVLGGVGTQRNPLVGLQLY